MTWRALHVKTSLPIKCRFLSFLTCVAILHPQTSCHLSRGPSRDFSLPLLCQARLKFRYIAEINLTYPSLWPQKLKSLICCRVCSDSSDGGLFSNTAAWAYLANAMGGEWPDAYMKELTCCAVGDDIKPPAVILPSSVYLFGDLLPIHFFPCSFHPPLSSGDHSPSVDWHYVPGGGTASLIYTVNNNNQTVQRNKWKKVKSPYTDSISLPCDWLTQIKAWEEEELDKPIDMEQIRIDPSPFQLVERTSLHKVTTTNTDLMNKIQWDV